MGLNSYQMVSFPSELMETFPSKNSAELCLRAGTVVLLRLWLRQRGARCQDLPTGKGGALGIDETGAIYSVCPYREQKRCSVYLKGTPPFPLHAQKGHPITQ